MNNAPPPATRRWALKLEFDGRDYVGWQRQDHSLSIQQVLEEAASRLFRKQAVTTITSGRTDAGVHASGMVVHMDVPADKDISACSMRDGINFHLKPHPVVILEAAPVSLEWNARFSALWRRYRYTILNRPSRPTFTEGTVWHVKPPLDAEAMQKGANYLLGRHDFSSFRAAACQAKNALRTLDELTITRQGELIIIETQARSFLHHQVRNMVGTLSLVGREQWRPEKMHEVLKACDRRLGGPTAPAGGLCFIGVGYPEDPFKIT
ncbi:tRNA pseudouridine(38-40) synthase TruA [Acetobacteraceae bacterium ESL0709]|nr:tRNA pseudouridine(38-40) synthase TruA [Acetobacteraceae bacterium ESL0697]MDF7677763.1 tRNA pseudouridine(38-40) synthase TruA [Acetobacteraceae bacterium ESL0709]